MKSNKILVKSKSKKYPIYIGNGNISIVGKLMKQNLPDVKKICLIDMIFWKKNYGVNLTFEKKN